MKYFILFLTLITGIEYSVIAQTPTWSWGKNGGGGAADYAFGTAIDASGNVYYCGNFYSTNATFGSVSLVSGGLADGFLCKYDANGNFKWVKQISGPDIEVCEKVVVNSTGDIFVTGYSEGDFSADGNTFTSYGEGDGFVAKYSNSGVLKWINHFGGPGDDYPYSLALDNKGKCVVVGTFEHSMSIGGFTLTSQNDSLYDCFVAKFDKQGNVLWATSAGGDSSHAYVFASDVTIDIHGSIFITGTYTGPVKFGDDSLGENEEAFLTKLNSNGIFQWAVDAGSRCYYTYIAVDASSNIYVTGSFGAYGFHSQIGDFTLVPNGDFMDVYLAKFNSSGVAQSVHTGGSELNDFAGGLASDAAGNTWITGYILGTTATFGSESFTSSGLDDVFVTGYDSLGNVSWLKKAAGGNVDHAFDLAYDGNNVLSIAGSFKKKIKLGGITLNAPSTSSDAWLGTISIDGFVKMAGSNEASFNVEVFPNPAADALIVKSNGQHHVELQVFNSSGELEMFQTIMLNGKNESTLDISSLPAGIYFLSLNEDGKKSVTKFTKQ
ncbi:MAG TPA: T9SS type A sorting domain-containing protein [Chitinophagales bacterium]|nr:T9SS type A sorting domain-containing protein [Chitinophagales bacterium]